jgi:hypothetical protein
VRRKRSILAVSYLPGEEDEDDEQAKEHSRQSHQTTSATVLQPLASNVVEHPIIEEQEETEPDSTVTTNTDRIRRTVSLYSREATVGKKAI